MRYPSLTVELFELVHDFKSTRNAVNQSAVIVRNLTYHNHSRLIFSTEEDASSHETSIALLNDCAALVTTGPFRILQVANMPARSGYRSNCKASRQVWYDWPPILTCLPPASPLQYISHETTIETLLRQYLSFFFQRRPVSNRKCVG